MSKENFTGKVAVITGSAKGIGKRTAELLAQSGTTVAITDTDIEHLEQTAKEFKEKGYSFISEVCDITNRTAVNNHIEKLFNQYGRIDILINNAGVLLSGSIEDTTDEMIDLTINVNIKGVIYAIQAVTPLMKKQKYGKIINVASITGKNGDNSTTLVYGASKGAVISLTRSVARQLGPFGINCNAIAPHAVMTDLMFYWSDEKKKMMADKIPVKRLGTETDNANLIFFLASDKSGFINGETININGGYYMD